MTFNDDAEHKFSSTGEVLPFHGNTVICFIDDTAGPIYRELNWAQQLLKASPCAANYAYVPPPTFHMTVIPLTDQTHRNTELWPALFKSDCEMKDIDKAFKKAVESVPIPSSIRMRIDSYTACRVNLSHYDEDSRTCLHRYREDVAAATGVRLPGHDSYGFHITLSYELMELMPEERLKLNPVLEKINRRLSRGPEYIVPGPPRFVVFNDMYEFHSDLSKRIVT